MSSTLNANNYRQKMVEAGQYDVAMYERYGKVLEPEHTGEYVAISEDGRLIVGEDHMTVSRRASEQFGRGKFTFRRIGWDYEGRIRALKS